MFMKRIIVALLVLTLAVNFAGSQGGAAAAETGRPGFSQFTDLFSRDVEYFKDAVRKFKDMGNHWADKAVGILVELKVIDGYPEDGTFRPENNITRAEFTKILVTSMKLDMKSGSSFTDTADHWSKDYVNTAVVNGIIKSSEFGTSFLPDVNITRLEMAKMVVRAAGLGTQAENLKGQTTRFSDDGLIGYNDKGFIKLASEKKIINGYTDNTFQPNGYATRAEASQMIVNLLKYITDNGISTPAPTSVPTSTPTPVPTPTPTPTTTPEMNNVVVDGDPILEGLAAIEGLRSANYNTRSNEYSFAYVERNPNNRNKRDMVLEVIYYPNNKYNVVTFNVFRNSPTNLMRFSKSLELILPQMKDEIFSIALERMGGQGQDFFDSYRESFELYVGHLTDSIFTPEEQGVMVSLIKKR